MQPQLTMHLSSFGCHAQVPLPQGALEVAVQVHARQQQRPLPDHQQKWCSVLQPLACEDGSQAATDASWSGHQKMAGTVRGWWGWACESHQALLRPGPCTAAARAAAAVTCCCSTCRPSSRQPAWSSRYATPTVSALLRGASPSSTNRRAAMMTRCAASCKTNLKSKCTCVWIWPSSQPQCNAAHGTSWSLAFCYTE